MVQSETQDCLLFGSRTNKLPSISLLSMQMDVTSGSCDPPMIPRIIAFPTALEPSTWFKSNFRGKHNFSK